MSRKCDCCNQKGNETQPTAMCNQKGNEPQTTAMPDIRIVILQRGWVAVGKFHKGEDGARFLTNASIVRVWGTTKGLGEICSGPTPTTKLDPCGDMAFHELTIISTMKADPKGWKNYVSWRR